MANYSPAPTPNIEITTATELIKNRGTHRDRREAKSPLGAVRKDGGTMANDSPAPNPKH